MVYIYGARLRFKPKIAYKDKEVFVKEVLRLFYADFKIEKISTEKGLIIVDYEFSAGAEIKGDREPFDLLVGDKIEFVSLVLNLKLRIKHKSYFEYVAECMIENKKPLSYEDFMSEYFEQDD